MRIRRMFPGGMRLCTRSSLLLSVCPYTLLLLTCLQCVLPPRFQVLSEEEVLFLCPRIKKIIMRDVLLGGGRKFCVKPVFLDIWPTFCTLEMPTLITIYAALPPCPRPPHLPLWFQRSCCSCSYIQSHREMPTLSRNFTSRCQSPQPAHQQKKDVQIILKLCLNFVGCVDLQ